MEITYKLYEEFPTNFSTDGNLSLLNFRLWQHEVYRTNWQKRSTTRYTSHLNFIHRSKNHERRRDDDNDDWWLVQRTEGKGRSTYETRQGMTGARLTLLDKAKQGAKKMTNNNNNSRDDDEERRRRGYEYRTATCGCCCCCGWKRSTSPRCRKRRHRRI